MNKAFLKDIEKAVKNTSVNQELSPGAAGRRWEPEEGVKKLNKKIHRESKYMDDHSKLPFTFSKPKKHQKSKYVRCLNCGYVTIASKNTVGIICKECKAYSSVEEVNVDEQTK